MIIQAVLFLGLTLCFAYAFLQRKKSSLISMSLCIISTLGIYFVIFPDSTTTIANFVGVDRGTDLILYCWVVISLLVSVNLQFNILSLRQNITQLTRELALHTPVPPPQDLGARRLLGEKQRHP